MGVRGGVWSLKQEEDTLNVNGHVELRYLLGDKKKQKHNKVHLCCQRSYICLEGEKQVFKN